MPWNLHHRIIVSFSCDYYQWNLCKRTRARRKQEEMDSWWLSLTKRRECWKIFQKFPRFNESAGPSKIRREMSSEVILKNTPSDEIMKTSLNELLPTYLPSRTNSRSRWQQLFWISLTGKNSEFLFLLFSSSLFRVKLSLFIVTNKNVEN